LHRRLLAYRDQTAPLATYYQLQNVLRSVDGMAPIPEVSRAIDRMLKARSERAPAASPPAEKAPGNVKKTAKTSVAVPVGKAAKDKPATRPPPAAKKAVAGAKKAGAGPKAQPKTRAKAKAKAQAAKTKAKTTPGKSAGRTASSRKSNRPRRLTKRH
jgi:adenylate kinase